MGDGHDKVHVLAPGLLKIAFWKEKNEEDFKILLGLTTYNWEKLKHSEVREKSTSEANSFLTVCDLLDSS